MSFNADQLYAKYQGQTLDYDGVQADAGQCVQWVEYALTDTEFGYGLQPFWGNAVDWWNNYGGSLLAFDKITDGSIKKGDIVIFNGNVGSVYGHIDLAMTDGSYSGFTGADSNWSGNKTVHLVEHNNPSFIIGSLRFKGEEMTAATLNDVRIVNAYVCGNNGLGGKPNALNGDMDSPLEGWVGQDVQKMLESFFNSAEAQNYREKLLPAAYNSNATELQPGLYKVG